MMVGTHLKCGVWSWPSYFKRYITKLIFAMSKGSKNFLKMQVSIGRAEVGRMEYESGLARAEMIIFFFYFFFILTQGHFFIALRERGRQRGREREKRSMRERSISWLPLICSPTRHTHLDWRFYALIPRPRIEPATWVCALTRNLNCNLLVMGQCSNQLSHTCQGEMVIIFKYQKG